MMFERRDVLKGGLAFSAAAIVSPGRAHAADASPGFDPTPGAWRAFEVTTQIDLPPTGGAAQAWLPLPSIAARDWSHPIGDTWKISNGQARVVQIGAYGTKVLHVVWSGEHQEPSIQIVSRVATRDRSVDFARPGNPKPLGMAERALFLKPTKFIPTDGIVKATADKIVDGAKTDEDKARLIYEWIVANTVRDPKIPGCGLGDISFMLKTGDLRGKCADLNALFVGLARASGIPARDLYGIRVAPSKFGYKSLGANQTVITKAQHCRAEVYLDKWGWVPADPADVRKAMLEEPPGNLPLGDSKVEAVHRRLFGAAESNWIAYNDGHDIVLPGSRGPELAFLMYPQAEIGGKRRDCLDADSFRYTIAAREYAI